MAPANRMQLSYLSGIIEIPQFGAEFYTLVGEAKTVAQIFLASGGGLNRHHRRLAAAHPFVLCNVRGDSETGLPARLPAAFNQTTLRWAVYSADRIAIWCAPFPQRADDVGRWGVEEANAGARFITTIETAKGRAPEWVAFVERWKRKTCRVKAFSTMESVQ
jgi:hypothetical protein